MPFEIAATLAILFVFFLLGWAIHSAENLMDEMDKQRKEKPPRQS